MTPLSDMQKDMQKAPTYNVILYFFSLWRQTIFYIPERPHIQVHLTHDVDIYFWLPKISSGWYQNDKVLQLTFTASIFGTYRFSIAWHFLTCRSLSSQLQFVYPPWSWGGEEQMLIFSSSFKTPGRSSPKVNHRTNLHDRLLRVLN